MQVKVNTFYQETVNKYIIDSCFNIYHKGISSDLTCIILELHWYLFTLTHWRQILYELFKEFTGNIHDVKMTNELVFSKFISINVNIHLIAKKILLWCGGNINKTMHVSDERLFWGDTADGRGKSKSNVYLCFLWVHI